MSLSPMLYDIAGASYIVWPSLYDVYGPLFHIVMVGPGWYYAEQS